VFVIGIFEHVVWGPARRTGWIQQTPQFSLSLLLFFHLSQVSLETAVMFD